MKVYRFALIITALMTLIPAGSYAQKKAQGTGIVAHRGYWNCKEAGFAKNSIASLRCAQEAGFWGSEFDVNMTSDDVLLVYHDGSVAGKKIENNPYAEFKDIRLKNGEPIPTIDQYLEQAKKHPETVLVYELKKHSAKERENRLVDLTITKLKEHGLLDPSKVIFISFSLNMCERLVEKLPDFTVQYLGGELAPSKVRAKGINGIDYNYKILKLNTKWVSKAHRIKMNTNAWTVNKDLDIRQMLDMKVDMLTTDTPMLVRDVMKDMGIKEL